MKSKTLLNTNVLKKRLLEKQNTEKEQLERKEASATFIEQCKGFGYIDPIKEIQFLQKKNILLNDIIKSTLRHPKIKTAEKFLEVMIKSGYTLNQITKAVSQTNLSLSHKKRLFFTICNSKGEINSQLNPKTLSIAVINLGIRGPKKELAKTFYVASKHLNYYKNSFFKKPNKKQKIEFVSDCLYNLNIKKLEKQVEYLSTVFSSSEIKQFIKYKKNKN